MLSASPHIREEITSVTAASPLKGDQLPTGTKEELGLVLLWLQGTGRAYQAWGIVAVAIRNCHRLGFHPASTTSEELIPDVLERELMKRVYHFCVLTERTVSLPARVLWYTTNPWSTECCV
jgi:hypothetical protein